MVGLSDGSRATVWSEYARADTATVLATYVDGPTEGSVAMTVHERGAGRAWYVGTELGDTRFGAFVDDLLDTEDYMPLNQFVENPTIAFRSSSIISQQGAISGGVGMGFLHDFAVPRTPDLVRVMADRIQATRTFWLLVHADLRRIPRVRAVAGFLTRLARAVMP